MEVVGIGTDLCSVVRIREAWSRHEQFCARICTAEERAYIGRSAERLAARFAAKEAAFKAFGLGLGPLGWHDVEVLHDDKGRPQLILSEKALAIAGEMGIERWQVSLSHEREMAIAVVILEGKVCTC